MSTRRLSIRSSVPRFGGLALAAIVFACASAPRETLTQVDNEESVPNLAQLGIRDVAILPVRVGSHDTQGVAATMRDEIKKALVAKLYSPLSAESIDRKLGPVAERRSFEPARLKGSFDEDAILVTELTQWESQWLRSHGKVLLGGTFALHHSDSGKVVWSREIRNRYVQVTGQVTADNAAEHRADVIRRFVRDALRNLPRKTFQADVESSRGD
jgi:hypothetical protein